MSEGELLEDRRRDFEDLHAGFQEPVQQRPAERIAAKVLANEDLAQPQAAVQSAEDLSGAVDEDASLLLPVAPVAQRRGGLDPGVLQAGDEHHGSGAILILSATPESVSNVSLIEPVVGWDQAALAAAGPPARLIEPVSRIFAPGTRCGKSPPKSSCSFWSD